MIRILPLLLLFSLCPSSLLLMANKRALDAGVYEEIRRAFNSPECTNPCWRGIEVGVTDKGTTLTILEENGVEFTLEGYGGNSIWLHHIPGGLFPNVAPGEFTTGGINVFSDGLVFVMNFNLDICASTVINAYGEPEVVNLGGPSPHILVYLDQQLFFGLDTATHRVDGVYLHLKESMFPREELEDWAEYADVFPEDCSDIFTKYDG